MWEGWCLWVIPIPKKTMGLVTVARIYPQAHHANGLAEALSMQKDKSTHVHY